MGLINPVGAEELTAVARFRACPELSGVHVVVPTAAATDNRMLHLVRAGVNSVLDERPPPTSCCPASARWRAAKPLIHRVVRRCDPASAATTWRISPRANAKCWPARADTARTPFGTRCQTGAE